MNIAILAQFPVHRLPDFSGLGMPGGHYATWLPQLAESLGKQDAFRIHWIALSDRITQATRTEWHGQHFHILPTSRAKRATTLFKADRAAIRAVLNEVQPVLVHGWGTEDVYALAAVLSGYPSLVSMQGILSYYALKSRMHPREYLQALLELFILRKADRVTTESEWGRRIVQRIAPRTPVDLVEYGVQYHFLDYTWEPDPRQPAAVFIGSVSSRKGIQDAVAAFRDPRLAGAELRVLGSGEGAWADTLRKQAPSNVKWLGRLSPQETAEHLTQAWCLVLPTRADTSPNVVKEARVIGLPVVSTRFGGQTTYIRDGEGGFLCEPGDIGRLSDRLADLLSDINQAKACGAVNHDTHRHQLHPERTAEGFLAIYQKMAVTTRRQSGDS